MTDDPRRAPGADLPDWIDQLTTALDDIERLLQVSSDVAHQVARPAVPVTMFVAGLAAATSNPSDVLAWIESRAAAWSAGE